MKARTQLLNWYRKNFRPLPWRLSQDPYQIWISEVMLQQTTVQAVIPYFERWLLEFKDVKALAQAPLDNVYEAWSGLGYYNRAQNLHKTAKILSQTKFPKTWKKWIELPGVGPYTARAITSFSYSERVGVLDGNVIRFLSRYYALNNKWWTSQGRTLLQNLVDQWANTKHVADLNQALIEIGATLCAAQSPKCLICPLIKSCQAFKENQVDVLPLMKPRRKPEHWVWDIDVYKNQGAFGFQKNNYAPWLKNQLIWPGKVKKLRTAPKTFTYKHSVTHYSIYINIHQRKSRPKNTIMIDWKNLKRKIPQSLIQKTFKYV